MAALSSRQKPCPPLEGQEELWWWSEGINTTSWKVTKCLLTNCNETFQNQVVNLSYMCLLLGTKGRYFQQRQMCNCMCPWHIWQNVLTVQIECVSLISIERWRISQSEVHWRVLIVIKRSGSRIQLWSQKPKGPRNLHFTSSICDSSEEQIWESLRKSYNVHEERQESKIC